MRDYCGDAPGVHAPACPGCACACHAPAAPAATAGPR
jgi:hypothetical protein